MPALLNALAEQWLVVDWLVGFEARSSIVKRLRSTGCVRRSGADTSIYLVASIVMCPSHISLSIYPASADLDTLSIVINHCQAHSIAQDFRALAAQMLML